VLQEVLALRLDIEMFMNEKGKVRLNVMMKNGFGILHYYVIPATT
jgi:hypothetical protein